MFVFVFFLGCFHLKSDKRRNGVQTEGLIRGRRSAVVVPSLPLPATPPPSTINPTPKHQNTLHLDSGGRESKLHTALTSPSCPHPAPEEKDESQEKEKAPRAAVASAAELDWELDLSPAGSEHPSSPTSISQGSLSDLSRPPSSLFSRSTNLTSGRSSVLSGKTSIVTAALSVASYICSLGLR